MNFFKKKKILVTGGNGFLGSYITKELIEGGNDVTILANKKNEIDPRAKLIVLDIKDREELLKKLKNFDVVYHIAGVIRTPETDIKELHFAINAEGTRNILEACRANDIKRFIFVSTVEVYGSEFKENIKETDKKNPSNYYAESKLLAETYCKEYAEKYNMVITVVRPSYIYGYGQYEGRLFSKLMNDALNKKKTELKPSSAGNDFIYVKDATSAIIFLGEKKQTGNFEDYNISSGKFTTIKEVFETVKFLTGLEYEINDIAGKDIERISFSIDKLKKAGYIPQFDLKKGLADHINCQKVC